MPPSDRGLVATALRLRIRQGRQQRGLTLDIVFHGEVRTQIGKDQDAERDAGLIYIHLSVEKITLPLLQKNLRLHYVRMGHFAAPFPASV